MLPLEGSRLPVFDEETMNHNLSGSSSEPDDDDAVIARALSILEGRMRRATFDTPEAAKNYCRLQLGGLDHEEFGVIFLDGQNRLIEYRRRMFSGTQTQTSVYPREIVKAVLAVNAAAVILTHNHPSGTVMPSRADQALTQTLKSALSLVDVRVMDHIVVSASDSYSFAERGLL